MRVLFVTERLPLPLDSGGRIRTYHLLRQAARRHRVTLVTQGTRELATRLCEQVGLERCALAGEGGRGTISRAWGALRTLADAEPYLAATMHASARMRREISRQCAERGFDLVHFDHLDAAVYRDAIGRTPYLLDEHNAEARLMLRAAASASGPWLRTYLELQSARLERFETEAVGSAAVTTAVSAEDAVLLRALAPAAGGRVRVVPNGVDVLALTTRAREPEAGAMIFVGSMDWFANADGAQWFVQEVLPRVRAAVPGARVAVVGRNPTAEVRWLARTPGVEVTGTVPDVGAYYARAQVCLVPLRVGGGTRLKILESFAAGVPVVSTTLGVEGIPARDGVHLLVADGAAEFAEAVVRVMRDDALAARLVAAGGALAREAFDWSAVGEQLDEAYGAAFGERAARAPAAGESADAEARVGRGEIRLGVVRGRRLAARPGAPSSSGAGADEPRERAGGTEPERGS